MGWKAGTRADKRRSLSIVLVVVLWMAAGIFTLVTVLQVINGDQPRSASSPRGAATQADAERSTSTAKPGPTTATGAAPDSAPSPAGEAPEDGPGVTAPGVLLIVSPTRAGTFDVWERVRLPDPVDMVTLSPPDVAAAGSQFEKAQPVATSVQLSVEGQPMGIPDGVVDGPVEVPVEAITEFELSYQLDGISVRSLPSTARRALAAVSPLLDNTPYNLPVAVIVNGPVLGIDCPLLEVSERSCGRGTTERMQVARNLPFKEAVVAIQFDLPAK